MRKAALLLFAAVVIATGCNSTEEQPAVTVKTSEASPNTPSTEHVKEVQIKEPTTSDILRIRTKAEEVQSDIFVSDSAWECAKNKEPEIAVPSAENGQFDIYFMCPSYGTREKVVNHLTKAVTKASAEKMINDHISSGLMAEVGGRMGVAPYEGVDTLNWNKSKVVDLHIKQGQAAAVIQVWDEADQEYDTYRATYIYEGGWKENSLDFVTAQAGGE
ncbi:hypothetical protein D3C71_391980 [compost metagenome]